MKTKRKTRTALMTPLQVREAIVDWAHRNIMFPQHWDRERAEQSKVVIHEDGSASLKVHMTKEEP
jgi:hypothetical protein